jgi:RecA-family ATPase
MAPRANYALKLAYSRRNDPERYIADEAGEAIAIERVWLWTVQGADARVGSLHRLALVAASSIKAKVTKWLWENRIPLGEMTLLAGREGIGKSILECELIAKITRGTLPGCYEGEPRNVIVVATEDSWEYTIVPRLMAAGADLNRVLLIVMPSPDGNREATVSLPDDLVEVERMIRQKQIVALMLDPLMSRLGRLDSHKDQEVRQALEPLVAMAHRTECIILGLIHVNKAQTTDPLTSIMASRAFSAVARAVLFVMSDPEDEDTRLLGLPKHNLGPSMKTLTYTVVGTEVADGITAGKLEWTGESDRSVQDALQQHVEMARSNTATSQTKEAIEWLRAYLTKRNGKAPSAECKKDAQGEEGFTESTMKRASKKLGLVVESRGMPRRTWWELPPPDEK